jgi:lysophospholipase L1-like esterase
MPSGGRVRFRTDSTALSLRIRHSRPEIAMPHMCAVGVSGIDLYEGPPSAMVYWGSNKPVVAQAEYTSDYFSGLSRKMREFTLYLPVYNDLASLEIGLDPAARVRPPTPFKPRKPVVIYGTSITQGGCSSRGANGFVPVVGRKLGLDVVNLGFSGNGQSDPEVAALIAELDMAAFVNDCVGNMNLELMKTRYAAFNESIRARHPRLPILFMTVIRFAKEHFNPQASRETDAKNEVVAKTFREFKRRGDKAVYFLDCAKVIGLEADHPSVDGVHLTDLGFLRVAEAVAPVLKRMLRPR